MTITVNPARNEYTATAGQTIFNYTFKIFSNSDLNVYITPTGQDADDATDITTAYTVTGVGDEAGGTVILNSGATLDDLITIVSAIPSSRSTDYQVNGDFVPDTVNDDFDKGLSLSKQVEALASRSLLFEESQQSASGLGLPAPVAGKTLAWNTAEDALENAPGIGTFTDLADETAANAAAAATSETNAATSETNAAASAADAIVAKIEWQGPYNAGAAYFLNDAVTHLGSSFISTQAGTGNTPVVGGTAFWDDLANRGDDGLGTGDMLAANNLSDVVSASSSRTNLGISATNTPNVAAGNVVATDVQAAINELDTMMARKNTLINADFRINQRAYVSGAATSGANEYTLDRWRVITSGQSITFAALGTDNTITCPAGGLGQKVKALNVAGGTYTISWTGTATCTVDAVARTNGESFTLTANTQVDVIFSSGTVKEVQLELGNVASDFDFRFEETEKALCRNYYYAPTIAFTATLSVSSGSQSTHLTVPFDMIGTPTIAITAVSGSATASVNSVDETGVRFAWSGAAGNFGVMTFTADAEL